MGEEPGSQLLQSNWTIFCDKSIVDDSAMSVASVTEDLIVALMKVSCK